jgi:hypothetical protein
MVLLKAVSDYWTMLQMKNTKKILGSFLWKYWLKKYQPQLEKQDKFFMKEFILWAMVEYKN